MDDRLHRREFLKVLTVASAGALAGCSSVPAQKLYPYVTPPEDIVPGVSTWYKSVCRECPAGCGTLVRTREGRVVKVEGNPDHPVNHGALCARGQAATQGLYNPDRIAQPLSRNQQGKLEPISWEQAEELVANLLRYLRFTKRASRIALVSERVTGSMERLLRDWLAAVGSEHFLMYEPFAYEAIRAGNRITFGTSEIPHYGIDYAQTLISFGADFLETWLSNAEFAWQFSIMRKPPGGRFIAVSPRISLTAANADQWLAVKAGSEMFVALGMLREILNTNLGHLSAREAARLRPLVAAFDPNTVAERAGIAAEKVPRLAREFAEARPAIYSQLALGPGAAASGPNATALQVAVNLLNYACGSVGTTVRFGWGADWDAVATHRQVLDFVEQMRSEQIEVVFFYHTNPAFTLPEAVGFSRALARVPFKVSFSPMMDETAAQCDLILPDHTPLERWEDYSPRAGVYGLVQPTMAPGFHFQSKQTGDFLLSVSAKVDADLAKRFPFATLLDYMREHWKALHRQFAPQKPFEEFWHEAAEAGGAWPQWVPPKGLERVAGTRRDIDSVWPELPVKSVQLSDEVFRFDFAAAAKAWAESEEQAKANEIHLVVYPSLQFFDGRGANRPWLQEMPDAMTKIVWDSWAEIHPETAKRLGIQEGDLLKLTSSSGSIQIPAHLYEGIHPGVIAVPLGQGHTNFGRWAEGHGPNPMQLLSAQTEAASGGLLWSGTRVSIERLAVNRPLAQTQIETSQHGRGLAQVVPLSTLLASSGPKFLPEQEPEKEPTLSMYPPHGHPEHRWGMAIDLNACVGCNACIVACYAENNVPVVGKEQVARGRHMAWIRIDRYFERAKGIGSGTETRFVPMLCQHCDNAPCESVCPVYATYHNHEGLNVQVYNRCVGTRYCSNNCPYKVRRFNWFDNGWAWPMQLGLNPDVSARSKGVMEKCTFCIQRIREAKEHAKDEKRGVRDGEITPACAQTCPAQAILFGDLNDPKSRVSQLAKDQRRYHVLGDLNTRPAIAYLKKVVRRGEG